MATKITGTVSGDPLIEVEIGGVFYPWKQAIDNWVTVTAVTGSPASASYTDADGVEWTYYKWTGSGSVTVTAGVVDALVLGGGGGGKSGVWNGMGGYSRTGLHVLPVGTHTITIGSGGAGGAASAAAAAGGNSSIGSLVIGTGGGVANQQTSFTSDITGTSLTYAEGADTSPDTNFGDGGTQLSNTAGSSGIAIIRVPSQFAQA